MNKIAPDLNERVPEGWRVVPLRWYLSCKSGESIDTQLIEKEPYEDKCTPVIGGNGIMGYSNKVNITNETLSIGRVGALCGNVHYIDYPCWITDNSLLISRYNRSEINLEFFKLILEQLNLNQYSTSTAQPLITGETIKKRKIALPSIEIQKRIVTYVNKKVKEIDVVINYKTKINKLLEEKRQAMITEAVTKGLKPNVKMQDSDVEWIGEIPAHWEVKKIKYCLELNPNKSEINLAKNEEASFIPMENIVETGVLDTILERKIEDVYNGYTYFANEDILMAKVTPCFENGNIAIATDLKNGIGFGTTELHVLRARSYQNNKFYYYFVQSARFMQECVSTMYGVGGLKRIPSEIVENFKFGQPPLEEQLEIVDYLEKQVKDITNLKSKLALHIQKLKEYRQSLIYEAVTGKIDVRNFEEEQ